MMQDATTPVAKENYSRGNFAAGAGVPGGGFWSFVALLAGNAALASGPLFVRLADVGPVAAAFWRLTLALPLLILFALWPLRAKLRTARPQRIMWLAVAGGLFFAMDLASWHLGILHTKMANATLFGNSASLILPLVTLVVARRLPVRAEGAALVLAVTGAVLLMRESSQQGEAQLAGDLLCLLAGILYAGYMLVMQRARRSMGSWQALALSSAAGTVPLLLFAMLLGEAVMPRDWQPVLLLALTSQIIGQGLLIYALPHFSALVIGLTLLTQPAVSAMIGWIVYGERMSSIDMVGGVLIAVALVLVRLPDSRRATG